MNGLAPVLFGGVLLLSLIPVALGSYLVVIVFTSSRGRAIGISLVFCLWFGLGYSSLTKGSKASKAEAEKQAREYEPHATYFAEACRKAGVRIFSTATDVRSIAIQAPRANTTNGDLSDQNFSGDVYGAFDVELPGIVEQRIVETFLTKREWEERWYVPPRDVFLRYPQVEVEAPDGTAGFFRYLDASKGSHRQFTRAFSEQRDSRYMVRWKDISTPQDREHWVAGSKWTIVDMETGEAMAERVGYAIDTAQGYSQSGGSQPWVRAGHLQLSGGKYANSCPPKTRFFNLEFVRSVLAPVEQEMKILPDPTPPYNDAVEPKPIK